ncbi:carbohydrate kinase [Pirellulales bacterium]|nr:carbohydrate kinase [Pirellulales bacterium]MDC1301786.1 carbohydrate kinase [bacterium]
MKRPTILSLGEVLWDLFPDGERFGGAPANFACHAAIQGADVTMLSAVGDDQNGHDAIGILSAYGVDVSLMQIIPDAPTGTVGVALDNNGKPTFVIHQGSAWDQLVWNDAMASRITTADAVSFGTLGQRDTVSRTTIRRTLRAAAAKGIPCILDINLRPPFFDAEMIRDSVQLASILKLSDDELVEVCSACSISETSRQDVMLQGLFEFGNLDIVVLTRGKDGAVLVTPDDTVTQNGISVNVIDTVGAGDSFTAAFLIGELRGESRKQNLRRSCEIAAATCAHSGAVPETKQNLEKHIRP